MLTPRGATAAILTGCLVCAGSAIGASTVDPRLAEARAAFLSFQHERAIRLLEPLARGGNAQAQRMLGWMYSNGQGVERDERTAARWYCESVRRDPFDGDAPCPWLVYLTRQQPEIVWESLNADGERWNKYRKAAEAGDTEAQVALGLLLAAGLETERDLVAAYMWLAIAAEKGHPTAGRLLENLELEMPPDKIAEGRRRAKAWSPDAPTGPGR